MVSNAKMRRQLRKAMAGTGVPVHLTARDLGVDAAPGLRRLPVQRKRLAKGGARADRLRAARLKGKRAVTQTNSLVVSTELYGVEATQMSATAMRKVRKHVLKAVCPGRSPRTCPHHAPRPGPGADSRPARQGSCANRAALDGQGLDG